MYVILTIIKLRRHSHKNGKLRWKGCSKLSGTKNTTEQRHSQKDEDEDREKRNKKKTIHRNFKKYIFVARHDGAYQ
jgi:hypothetical protein